jgi:hypothetical protein
MESFLLGGRHVPPTLDPHRCRFGRWLDSERTNPIADTAAFRDADRFHQQIHALADVASAWDPAAAGADVQLQLAELHRLRDALLEQLNLLLQDSIS